MATATLMTPGPVEVGIGYLHPGDEDITWHVGTVGQQKAVAALHRPPIKVQDLRDNAMTPTLDGNGFQHVSGLPAVPKELATEEEALKPRIYQETIDALKNVTGASHAFIFSHICRSDSFQKVLDIPDDTDPMQKSGLQTSAQFGHVDQSYHGAGSVMSNILDRMPDGPDKEALRSRQGSRWAIINTWRPIATINREPLACADGRSVPTTDLRPAKFLTGVMNPDKPNTAELWMGVHKPEHSWYWVSNMTPSEALLIKCFDTRMDAGKTCRRSLHSAFRHPEDHGPGRSSVELRAFVFWDDQPQSELEKKHAFDNDYREN